MCTAKLVNILFGAPLGQKEWGTLMAKESNLYSL